MSKCFLFFSSAFTFKPVVAQADWEIAGNKVTSSWAEKLDTKSLLPDYPRHQIVRHNGKILNRLREYSDPPKAQSKPV